MTTTFTRGDTVSWDATGNGKVACWVVVGGPEQSQVVLVGDDHIHHADNSDLKLIDPGEFCGGCGQIGCGHE